MIQTELIDSLGKLSIEVVAILTLAYIVYTQGRGHEKMSKSIDKLIIALNDRKGYHVEVKKTVDNIHKKLNVHHDWSKTAVSKLTKKNVRALQPR